MSKVRALLLVMVSIAAFLCGPLQGFCSGGFVLHPQNWLYILQDAEVEAVARSGFDLVVMDYSKDGSDENRYTEREIEQIKAAGLVPICYLSIGEAEDYRFYWQAIWKQDPPFWLGRTNPDWKGNYKVRYWEEEWQQSVFSYLDRVLDQGFLGVYLDIIDAFEYWANPQNGEPISLNEELAAQQMIVFVKEIAHYCREETKRSSFYIIPQNGERILDYDADGSYLATISGIGVEDLWYNETEFQPQEDTSFRLSYLSKIVATGKPIFSIDYVDDGSGYCNTNRNRIDDYLSRVRAAGFIPYVARTDRALDRIVSIPGLQSQ